MAAGLDPSADGLHSTQLTPQPRRRVPWKRRGRSRRAHCVRGGKDQAGLLRSPCRLCPRGPRSGCSTPFPSLARPTAPCCEIRFLVLHTYPDGIKAYGHERITTPIGRRGKPVKKLRLIPAEDAYAMAQYFQGTPGTTVSVI